MYQRADDKITTSQAAFFLTSTVLGAGILTMPRSVTQTMKTPDSWLTIILAGAAIMLAVLLMTKLCQQFPGETVFQFAGKIVGKLPGGALCFIMVLYFVVIAGFEIRSLAEVTLFFLLEGTPMWALVIPFIWTGTYLVCGGINSIARVYQIILPMTILVLLVSYAVSLRLFNINNLRPVLGEGVSPVLRGLKSSILVYSGIEVVLTLVAFMQHPKHAVKAMLGGITIPIGIYLLTVVMVIGGLSIDCVITGTWPTIDLIRSFEVTGFFVERLEFPLMVVWLMQMFCNFCSFFYQASLGISQVFRVPVQPVIFALVPVLFLITMVPKSQQELFWLGDIIGWGSAILFFLVPVPLLLIQIIRLRRLKQHA